MEQEQIRKKLNQLFQGVDHHTNQVKDATENLLTIGEHLNRLPKPAGIDVDTLIQKYSGGVSDIMRATRQIKQARAEMETLLNQQ